MVGSDNLLLDLHLWLGFSGCVWYVVIGRPFRSWRGAKQGKTFEASVRGFLVHFRGSFGSQWGAGRGARGQGHAGRTGHRSQ